MSINPARQRLLSYAPAHAVRPQYRVHSKVVAARARAWHVTHMSKNAFPSIDVKVVRKDCVNYRTTTGVAKLLADQSCAMDAIDSRLVATYFEEPLSIQRV